MIVDSHFKVSTFLDERFNWKTEHTITFVGTEWTGRLPYTSSPSWWGIRAGEWNRRRDASGIAKPSCTGSISA